MRGCRPLTMSGAILVGTVVSAHDITSRELQETNPHGDILRRVFEVRVVESFTPRTRAGRLVQVFTGRGGGDCGVRFAIGERYFIAAQWSGDVLSTTICSHTVAAIFAGAEIRELRRRMSSEQPSDLSGTVVAASEGAGRSPADTKPLSNIVVNLTTVNLNGRNDGTVFRARTDHQGVFAWNKLPAGLYTLSAELPPGLSIRNAAKGKFIPIEIPTSDGTGAACRALVLAAPDPHTNEPAQPSP